VGGPSKKKKKNVFLRILLLWPTGDSLLTAVGGGRARWRLVNAVGRLLADGWPRVRMPRPGLSLLVCSLRAARRSSSTRTRLRVGIGLACVK